MNTTDGVVLIATGLAATAVLVSSVLQGLKQSRREAAWTKLWDEAGDSAQKRALMASRPAGNDFADTLEETYLLEEISDLEDQERLGVGRNELPFARRADEARRLGVAVHETDTVESLLAKLHLRQHLEKNPTILQDMPSSVRKNV